MPNVFFRPVAAICLPVLLLTSGCTGKPTDETGDSGGPTIEQFTEPQTDGITHELHTEIESLVYVNWTQNEPATVYVEYSFDPDEWHATPAQEVTEAQDVNMLLLGIPYEMDFSYRVVNDFGSGPLASDEHTGETGDLPDGMPQPTLIASDDTQYEPTGNFLMGSVNQKNCGWCSGTYWKYFIDRKGRVVWSSKTERGAWTIFMRTAVDGKAFLWDSATWWSDYDMGAGSQIHRMKIDGTIEESITAYGLHHAFTELPDGTLVWGAATSWNSEELYKREADGTDTSLWSCDQFETESGGRWNDCQSNTLFYDEGSDSFYYSFYSLDTIVQVDHETGTSLRWFGDISNSWSFDPFDSQFWWMHGVSILDNGNMLTSTHCSEHTSNCCAREYEFDEASETLVNVWSFGDDPGTETVRADTAGEAHRLSNGNTLHNYGSGSRVREVTDAGDIVWDMEFSSGKLIGRTTFVDDLYDFAP